MIVVHEGFDDPILINPDCIESVCNWNEYTRIKFNSGREVHAMESAKEISAMLEKETKKNG